MSRALAAPVLAAAVLLLAACGGGEDGRDDQAATESSTPSTSARPSSTAAGGADSTTSTPTTPVFSPEQEAEFVANVTAQTFTDSGEALSQQLVKANPLVEAQTDFRFDQPTRTVVVAVTSVFGTGSPDVPYGLARDFAPVFWGPEGTGAVRVESLPLFSITVDSSTYLCDAPAMVALADRELSTDMFVERCAVTP